MNVEIGAEAAQLPEKKYINGIAVAVLLSGIAELCRPTVNISLCPTAFTQTHSHSRRFVRLRIELRLVIRFLHRKSACFYGNKSGKCDIELVLEIVST
jgi:hypothetical protein